MYTLHGAQNIHKPQNTINVQNANIVVRQTSFSLQNPQLYS